MNLEFTFEPSAWELTLEKLNKNDRFSAVKLLTVLEDADETELENALLDLEERHICLDITDLPKLPCEGEAASRLQMEINFARQEDLLSGLDENDPLRLYLEELSHLPAAGDPAVLAQTLAAGDERVIPQLTNLMLGTVVDLALGYTGRGVLLLDLIQEGSLGLWKGLGCFKGGDIDAHCRWWICQYMAGAVTLQAKASGLGERLRRAVEDYRNADQKLLTDLGRNPTLEEIAQYLQITPEEAASLDETLQAARLLHRAKKQPEERPEEDEQAVEDTAYFQMRQRISELLSVLSQEDAAL